VAFQNNPKAPDLWDEEHRRAPGGGDLQRRDGCQTLACFRDREEGEVHEMRETLGTQKVAALSLEGSWSIAGEHREVDDSKQQDSA
jgi:hypothetical protein